MSPDLQEATTDAPVPQRAVILLAAGASTRLGRPKQLIRFRGKSLLRHAIEVALEAGASPVIVVLGKDAAMLAPELGGLPVVPVINHAWEEGMGSSLRYGVEALRSEAPLAVAVLLMVCDQPFISTEHLQNLWARHESTGKIIAVRHNDKPGVPAIFPAKYIPELAQITGDKGARGLLRSLAAAEIEFFELPEAGFDLDLPEDLARIADDEQKAI